ncbi:MAG: transglycosylase domain-containing protein [Actinomycetota bacterium]
MARPPRSFVAALVIFAFVASACRLPKLDEAEATAPGLEQTSYVYDADKHLITALHDEQDREVVPLSKIPKVAQDAVIAVEDQRFWEHGGVDARAIMRAAAENVEAGGIVQGGSTITEQYVKNALLTNEQTLARKWNEAVLAYQMEQKYTKEQILQKYLNTVYFGEGAYGIQTAAERYFSKPAAGLSLPQAALLAGLIASPNDNSPLGHKKKAVQRRNIVLDLMLKQGLITQQQSNKARHGGLHLNPSAQKEEEYFAPYFVDYVKRWFLYSRDLPFGTYDERAELLFGGGLRIYTTMDPKMQRYADTAVNNILSAASDPYGAMTVVDPKTGFVKAMVGGRDWFSGSDNFAGINVATGGSTGRQAGSSFKPFILVAALENGVKPSKSFPAPGCIVIRDKKYIDKPWKVCNADLGSYGGSINMTAATAGSVNTYFAQLMMAVGPNKAVEAAEEMGIRCCTEVTSPDDPLQAVPSAVLGTEEVSTLEMASAFGTIANGGRHVDPVPVSLIKDAEGQTLWKAEQRAIQVVDQKVIADAVPMLEGVVSGGTGTAANIGRPQIGKTGTAQNYSDAWFLGAVPQLSAAVWVGHPEGQKPMGSERIGTVYGGTWPAQIWRAFMSKAVRGLPRENFPKGNVAYVTVEIDTTRNCVASKYTPKGFIDRRSYVRGSEPKKCKQPTSFGVQTVPLVVGRSQELAELELKRIGFEAKVVKKQAGKPYNVVVDQDPGAGEEHSTNKAVTIIISVEDPPGKESGN